MSGWRKYELAQKHEDAGKRNTYLTYLYQRLFLDARRYLVCGHGEGVMDNREILALSIPKIILDNPGDL